MKIKRIVFSDLDGTVYGYPDKNINPNVIKSVNDAIKNDDITFILNTGNPPLDKVKKIANELNASYIIFSGGSVIYDNKIKEIAHVDEIPLEIVKKVIKLLENNIAEVIVFAKNNYYITNKHHNTVSCAIDFFEYDNFLDTKELIDDNVFKIEIYINESTPEKVDNVNKILLENKIDLNIVNLKTHLEITPNNINKGTAIKKMCELLDVDINYVMSIGDSYNDASMFEVTKFSYVMDNAIQPVKKLANFYTSSVEQNGLGEAIIDYVFRTKFDIEKQNKEEMLKKWEIKKRRDAFYRNLAEKNKK
ncbi:HAD superfamily hydrolase Cof [Mycoplasmopsis maculosa]|uniref:HAD superfamily hydrolase Cof n=1 Tax=Mycoplasmopsis maculosa TaxID=114885 RepID=A0A449B4Q0_9BACT|nr:Cof-type HAD-IIB family hydrolase [Mycoplasmopsis maculosa]VEU75584.1 HAD superfamily hydrolase Cof [Mycoplasmopsis maculosa]